MAKIWIDGKNCEADPSKNLLEVCLSHGFDLPYFCWHPALGSVGACRQCAVKQFKDEADTTGKLIMACLAPASDGTRISISDEEAKDFRAAVIEWLMVNHPHDCPVCDEGGECHLQDMTVMTGHAYRAFRFKKRTYRNQDLGPFINHEMNRCIQCYRCVRFYRDFAGGRDLQAFAAHDHVYFGRHEDGVLESEFSGNLVEVCPTGVFTDKTLKTHYTRKWDLQTAPSVCVQCGLGCNTIPGERYGSIRRIRARYNSKVNGYFICDRGRYGYEFVNGERRIRRPLAPKGSSAPAESISVEEAVRRAGFMVADPERVIGIGSPRASLEGNFALRKLVGEKNFYQGVPEVERQSVSRILEIMRGGPARTPSLAEVEQADAVLVLGEDATQTAPMLALALRQSIRRQPMAKSDKLKIPRWHDDAVREVIQDDKGPLFIATPAATRLDDAATRTYRATPEAIARLGYAVAHEIDESAPRVADLDAATRNLAAEIAGALREAARPLVVSGTGCGSDSVVEAAANVARALSIKRGKPAELFYTVPECNSVGLGLIGGKGLEAAFERTAGGGIETVVILENDLYRRADSAAVERFLSSAKNVIVMDHVAHETGARASLVLPAGAFAETDGTLVNNEGRAQRFFQVFVPEGDVRESWRWARDVIVSARGEAAVRWEDLDDVTAAISEALPDFKGLSAVAPTAEFRVAGARVPRQPHRYSGRTAMLANVTVHEPKPPADPDSALSFSMEGYGGQAPGTLFSDFWAPGWNSIQSLNKFQSEVGGALRGGDPGVRLVEAAGGEKQAYFRDIPGPFTPRSGVWRIVPLYHIYGSEELSALSPAVAELAPAPYVALRREDAERLGASEGTEVKVEVDGVEARLPVRLRDDLPEGTAGVPAGLPGFALGGAVHRNRILKVSGK